MANQTFTINIFANGRAFRPTVEVLYYSDQLVKVVVRGGQKEMYMQKNLLKKRSLWAIEGTNYDIEGEPKDVARIIYDIQKEIEKALGC
jgi:hypothetical protein